MKRLRRKKHIFDQDHNDIGEGKVTKEQAEEFIKNQTLKLQERINEREKARTRLRKGNSEQGEK